MSHLWSGQPVTIRLQDLQIVCSVLSSTPNDLLVLEQDTTTRRTTTETAPLLRGRSSGVTPGGRNHRYEHDRVAAAPPSRPSEPPARSCEQCFTWGVLRGNSAAGCENFAAKNVFGRGRTSRRHVPVARSSPSTATWWSRTAPTLAIWIDDQVRDLPTQMRHEVGFWITLLRNGIPRLWAYHRSTVFAHWASIHPFLLDCATWLHHLAADHPR